MKTKPESQYVVQRREDDNIVEYVSRDEATGIIEWGEMGVGRMFDNYATAQWAANKLGGFVKKITVTRVY